MNENHTPFPPPPTPSFSIHQCSLLTSAGRVFDIVDNHQFRIREPFVLSFDVGEKKKTRIKEPLVP